MKKARIGVIACALVSLTFSSIASAGLLGFLTQPSADDVDGDGVRNRYDNCVTIKNSSQADLNRNGIGDVCESGSSVTTSLRNFTQQQLDWLFAASVPGPNPTGRCEGYATAPPFANLSKGLGPLVWSIWRGKEFYKDTLGYDKVMDILSVGTTLEGNVFPGVSIYDGAPVTILSWESRDDKFTNIPGLLFVYNVHKIAFGFYDENRMVAPGIYMGFSHSNKLASVKLANYFLNCRDGNGKYDWIL